MIAWRELGHLKQVSLNNVSPVFGRCQLLVHEAQERTHATKPPLVDMLSLGDKDGEQLFFVYIIVVISGGDAIRLTFLPVAAASSSFKF